MSKRIKIPFNSWSRTRLISGKKYATSRNKRYGEVGDTFEAVGMRYVIRGVCWLPLWFVGSDLFESEGCDSPSEFVDVWNAIHPRKRWVPDQYVWYHLFVPVEIVKEKGQPK